MKRIAGPAILLAVVFAVYYPSLKFGFILDDHRFTLEPRIQESGHIVDYFSNFVWAQFTGGPPSFYRPVFLLWMRLNYLISELSPWGWHFLSIAKHVLVTFVLGVLIYRLLGDRVVAFAGAALFALHPSHTESVSWVTVPDPLLTVGILLSLLFYLRYVEGLIPEPPTPIRKSRKTADTPQKSSGKWLLASATAYFAALLSKETAIVFLPVILVLVFSGTENEDPVDMKRTIRAPSAAFGVATLLYFLLRWNALDGKLAAATQHLPWKTVVLSWPTTLWFYVRALLWPVRSYSFGDPTLIESFSVRDVLLPLLGLICVAATLTAVSVWAWKAAQNQTGEREAAKIRFSILAGILLLVLPLLLALNLNALNPGDFLHGRYVYLPLAGLSLLVAVVLRLAVKLRPVLLGLAGAMALAFLPLTWAQEKQWQDDSTVFTTGHQLAPHNLPVARNLTDTQVQAALLIADDGRCEEAMPVFNDALEKYSDNWYAWAGRGICLVGANDLVSAEDAFHRAADLSQNPAIKQQWQALREQMGLPTSPPTK